MDSLQGQLLVAAPTLLDPNFARTVVVIANHDEDGALGVTLNRPTDTLVAEATPELAGLAGEDAVIHSGGPVHPAGVVVLAEFRDLSRAAFAVAGNVGLVGDDTPLAELGSLTRRCRVYAGYSGWGPGQLEDEVAGDDWIVVPARPSDVFTDDHEGLWGTALERLGGQYRLLARMPLDPSLN